MSQEENERVLKGQRETRPIAQRIEQGTAYHETVKVWFIDRTEHEVTVHALSSGQFYEAIHMAGVKVQNLSEINFNDNITLSEKLIPMATGQPDILKKLMLNEDAKIIAKILEISQPPKSTAPSASTSS